MATTRITAKKINTAIIAYKAYHDAATEGDENGRKVWARMIRDTAPVFKFCKLDVDHIISWVNSEDAKVTGETVAEYNARRCREMFGE